MRYKAELLTQTVSRNHQKGCVNMPEKLVIALGGNALQSQNSEPTAQAQLEVVKKTCGYLAELSAAGYEMAVVHGNGPQVGRILLASETARDVVPPMPFDVCGAMSQGYIGYHIQQALRHALRAKGKTCPVTTVVTQVVVDGQDPAFEHPTKPIGPFYSKEEAEVLQMEKGYRMKEDAGRGWRRVVASPRPQRIVEIDAVKLMWDHAIIITCGGGGVPVAECADGTLRGVDAVIDKDYAAELLAEEVDADVLMILTEVEKVAIRFGTPQQENLDHLTVQEAKRYIAEGQFGAGSMLPKVEAALRFVQSAPGKKAIITSLDHGAHALAGNAGTLITAE